MEKGKDKTADLFLYLAESDRKKGLMANKGLEKIIADKSIPRRDKDEAVRMLSAMVVQDVSSFYEHIADVEDILSDE